MPQFKNGAVFNSGSSSKSVDFRDDGRSLALFAWTERKSESVFITRLALDAWLGRRI